MPCGCAGSIEKPSDAPFVLEFFMVECKGYRGMAYRDHDSRWRNAQTHEVLSGEVFVLE
jgi:hypothetical protein